LRSRDGRKTWVFQYAIGTGADRINRRIKIGDYPALSPGKARREAEDLHAKVHLHGDPAVERRRNRAEANKTFSWLAARYLSFKKNELRPRSFAEVARHLEHYAEPLHNLPLASIDQPAIAGSFKRRCQEWRCDRQPGARKPFGDVHLGNEGGIGARQ